MPLFFRATIFDAVARMQHGATLMPSFSGIKRVPEELSLITLKSTIFLDWDLRQNTLSSFNIAIFLLVYITSHKHPSPVSKRRLNSWCRRNEDSAIHGKFPLIKRFLSHDSIPPKRYGYFTVHVSMWCLLRDDCLFLNTRGRYCPASLLGSGLLVSCKLTKIWMNCKQQSGWIEVYLNEGCGAISLSWW